MKATITRDLDKGQGYGIIVITGAPAIPGVPAYSIQNSSAQEYLTQDGKWVSSKELITPERYGQLNGILSIAITPEILGQLDSLEAYRMTLGESGEPFSLLLPDVLPSGCIARVPDTDSTPPVPPVPPAAETQPVAEPATMEPEPVAEPPLTAPQPQKETQPEEPKPQSRSRQPLVIAIVVLLVAIAGGLLWYLGQKSQTPEPQPGPAAALPEETPKTESGALPAEPGDEPVPAQQDAEAQAQPEPQPEEAQSTTETRPVQQPRPFLAQAKQYLGGSADPEESVRMAKPYRTPTATAPEADGAFLLIEDAAQHDHAEAMFLLAQFYDPLNTLARGTIEPDAEQARNWYRKAANEGVPGAGEALQALHDDLQKKADAGDSSAATLLKNW